VKLGGIELAKASAPQLMTSDNYVDVLVQLTLISASRWFTRHLRVFQTWI